MCYQRRYLRASPSSFLFLLLCHQQAMFPLRFLQSHVDHGTGYIKLVDHRAGSINFSPRNRTMKLVHARQEHGPGHTATVTQFRKVGWCLFRRSLSLIQPAYNKAEQEWEERGRFVAAVTVIVVCSHLGSVTFQQTLKHTALTRSQIRNGYCCRSLTFVSITSLS